MSSSPCFLRLGEPVYLLLLLFSVGLNYLYGRVIELLRGTPQAGLALAVILFIDLGLLGVFKYSGLAVETVNSLLGLSLPVPRLSLPIGISFYTFQIISYIIDVYRGECPAQRSFSKFLLFVSLYHQPCRRADRPLHRNCRTDRFPYRELERDCSRFRPFLYRTSKKGGDRQHRRKTRRPLS